MVLRIIVESVFALSAFFYIAVLMVSWRRRDFHLVGKLILTVGIVCIPAVLLCLATLSLFETIFPTPNLLMSFLCATFLVISLGALILVVWKNVPKLTSLFFLYGIYDFEPDPEGI